MTIALAAAMLAACSDDVLEERASENANVAANSLLQVRTRGTGDEATISYPVQVYVFQGEGSGGSGAECVAVQTIGDAGQALNIALTEGTYSVHAVGGASSTDYNLPTKDEATATSAITLRDGKALTDLMAASATATLADGGTNTVTLSLQRKTMLIDDVTIKQIPSAATAVSVTIIPLWQSLTIGGTFSTAGQSTTIALTRQDDGRTWKYVDPESIGDGADGGLFMMPPSSQPASISVNITVGGSTQTYTYSTTDQLEAGYKLTIDGTYTEAVGVNLTGTITGATWLGVRTISFEFDENGSNASGTNGDTGNGEANNGQGNGDPSQNTTGEFPAAGDTYQGCFVLASTTAADGLSAELTLLSPTELTDIFDTTPATMQSNIETALSTVTSGGISGWEVPTTAEATLIYDARMAIDNLSASSYLCYSSGYRAFKPTDATFSAEKNNVRASTVLRPVATITLTKN